MSDVEKDIAQISNQNLGINTDFQIWQRGKIFTKFGYTADRWRSMGSANFNVVQTDNGIRLSKEITTAPSNITLIQLFERPIKKKITVSIKMKCDVANVVEFGTTRKVLNVEAKFIGLKANVWEISTLTLEATSEEPIENIFIRTLSPDKLNIDVEWTKWEYGDKATIFETRDWGQELALCQRYYQVMPTGFAFPSCFYMENTMDFLVPLAVSMRTTPTIKLTGIARVKNCDNAIISDDFKTPSVAIASCSALNVRLTKASHGIKNGSFWLVQSGLIELDAEIY